MKYRRLLFRYWWFFALILIALVFTIRNRHSGTIKERELTFGVDNAEVVTRIIVGKGEDQIDLVKDGAEWKLKGSELVNRQKLEALLFVISNLKVTSPVPIRHNDNLLAKAREQGIRIQLFAGRRKLKDFFIDSANEVGIELFGFQQGAGSAYRLEVLFSDIDVFSVLTTELSYWNLSQVRIPSLETIAAIEVEIPQKLELSFRIDIKKNSKQRSLFALYSGSFAKSFNKNIMEQYLSALPLIGFGHEVSNLSNEDKLAITLSEPDYIFNFFMENGKQWTFRVIPIPIEEYLDEFGRTVAFDLNKVYVYVQEKEAIFEVAYIELYPILRDINFFQPKF